MTKNIVKLGLSRIIPVFCVLLCTMSLSYALEVNGIMNTDTTWQVSDSPVKITGSLIISQGATLQIEPGVEVIFSKGPLSYIGYYLKVDGSLKAAGISGSPVVFTGEDINFPWGCIAFSSTSQNCELNNCVIEYAGNSQNNRNVYGNAAIRIFNASPDIENCIIRKSSTDGIRIDQGSPTIKNNWIYNTDTALILLSADGVIDNNYFVKNNRTMYLDGVIDNLEVKNNTIDSNSSQYLGSCISLHLRSKNESVVTGDGSTITQDHNETITITNNQINYDNTTGSSIVFEEHSAGLIYTLDFSQNNIQAINGGLAVFINGWQTQNPTPIDMKNNWWGTTTEDEIKQLIYDSKNDYSLPTVEYYPFATSEISDAKTTLTYPPIANAGEDITTQGDMEVILDGSNSYHPDGFSFYKWTQTSGTTVNLVNPLSVTTSFIAPILPVDQEVLTFQLEVGLANNLTDTDTVSVIVKKRKIADAGSDQSVESESIVSLDGSGSYDPDRIYTYKWTQTQGTSVDILSDTTAEATFVAPTVINQPELLSFRLTVSLSNQVLGTDDVNIIVNKRQVANAGPDKSAIGDDVVVLDGSSSLSIDENTTFKWTQISGAPVTLIDEQSKTASFIAPLVVGDPQILIFELSVSENNVLIDTDTVNVTVSEKTEVVERDRGECFIQSIFKGFK